MRQFARDSHVRSAASARRGCVGWPALSSQRHYRLRLACMRFDRIGTFRRATSGTWTIKRTSAAWLHLNGKLPGESLDVEAKLDR
jgi:hypothetical protein